MSETRTDEQLAAILDQSVQDATKALYEMSLSELARLRALESAAEKPRVGMLSAIDDQFSDVEARMAQMGEDLEVAAARLEEAGSGGKEARGEQVTPPWKELNYTGPLTGEQAAWRNENIVIKGGQRVLKKDVKDAEAKQ